MSADRSFATFYAHHHAPIARALSLTLGDADLGVEAADEAMTRACQRWETVRGYDNPEGWVYRVGLNWATSWLRRRRRMTSAPLIDTEVNDKSAADPELARALMTLDHHHRSVVVLRYLLDWPVEWTAAALDIPPGTVKSRLSRALAKLASELGAPDDLLRSD